MEGRGVASSRSRDSWWAGRIVAGLFAMLALISSLDLGDILARGSALRPALGVPGAPIVFTAVGDYGASPDATATLRLIPKTGADFHLALGDFSYHQVTPELAWCSFVLPF